MYINIQNLFRLPNPLTLPILLVLRHAHKKDVSDILAQIITDDQDIETLIKEGYLKYIKGNSKQNELQKLRLNKKGTRFLNELDEPEVEEQDKKIFDWLKSIYVKRGKKIGNGKRTQRHIASFREKSGIELNNLAYLCRTFINDDDEQEFSFMLEYVFYKPLTAYATRFVLEDSRLYKYYIKNKNKFDIEFKRLK